MVPDAFVYNPDFFLSIIYSLYEMAPLLLVLIFVYWTIGLLLSLFWSIVRPFFGKDKRVNY